MTCHVPEKKETDGGGRSVDDAGFESGALVLDAIMLEWEWMLQ